MVNRVATKTSPRVVDVMGLPPAQAEVEMTPEQKENAALKHQLAVALGRKDGDLPESEYEMPAQDSDAAVENIIIHFVKDGFSALGHSWYRGQELEFTPGTKAFQQTVRNGRSWVLMDDAVQMERLGDVFFRRGPWPGQSYDAIRPTDFPALKVLGGSEPVRITDEDLRLAAQREANRRRAAPVMSAI